MLRDALWHKGTKPLNDLTLEGLSLLRNHYHLKPEAVLADGAFSTDKLLKRLEGYGWATVMRCKRDRKFAGQRLDKAIARGYGSLQDRLKNGVKVKIFRRKTRFFVCNRMLWSMQKAITLYKRRWQIEDTFRALKICLPLNACQQHREASPWGTPCNRRAYTYLWFFCSLPIWRSFPGNLSIAKHPLGGQNRSSRHLWSH